MLIPKSSVALNSSHQVLEDMNKFNDIHGEEPNEPPREWKRQSPESQFKPRTSPPQIIPLISDTMGILNHNIIDNGGVEVHPS